jgi:Xaa-Pro dipeptidase
MEIQAIQAELRASKIDGWLFCDFHHRDPIASRILGLGSGLSTRRWYYFVPAKGGPRKLVHRIEAGALDHLPGAKTAYSGREELQKFLPRLMSGAKTIAMQYSPKNNIPYVAMVDAGTVELVRSFGKKIVTSADLVQKFEASWSAAQLESHREAGKIIDRIRQHAFERAASFVREKKPLTEYELRQWILGQFSAQGIITADPPVVAIGRSSGDPHYEPRENGSKPLRAGELLLLDMWGKFDRPGSVYYDITWVGFLGKKVPAKEAKVFGIVREARDRAVRFVEDAVAAGRKIHGWEVDHAAREVIRKAGYGKYFIHRTGHNIGQDVHGNGANMDGLETLDDRRVAPRTCFSVEPGIYLPEFGVRSEVNVYVGEESAGVTGEVQTDLPALLA